MSQFTTTPNLGLFKPLYDQDDDSWGDHLNLNADALDAWVGPGGAPGPFLPLRGGAMTGPLMLTATGGTTSRSVQARFGEVRNVHDFGAVGDGVADDTTAIRNAIGNGGQVVYFPAGTYKVTGLPFVLRSHTRVLGAGPEVTTIRLENPSVNSWPGGADVPQVFIGYVYSVIGPWANNVGPPGGVYDTDISIEGIGFDFSRVSACIGSFYYARDLMLSRLKLWAAPATWACTGVRSLGCDKVTMTNCSGTEIVQLLDSWAGTTRVKLSDLDLVGVTGGGNGGAFNLQGVGTVNNTGHSWRYQATNINATLNGGVLFFLDSQGGGSISSDILLSNIQVVAASGANQVIVARGRGGRLKVHDMNCVALDGATWATPFLVGDFFSYVAQETGPNKITTASGSSTITVTFSVAGTEAGVGNYVSISNGAGGPLIGNGLTLGGSYRITAIVDTHGNANWVVRCDARANATAAGPIATATAIIGYQGGFHDCEFNGVTFDGAQQDGVPVVTLSGYGHQISNFNVTTNYGAGITSPRYSELFSTDITSEPAQYAPVRPVHFDNISAAPGAGPVRAGYSGNTLISYSPYGPAPQFDMTGGVPSASGSVTSGLLTVNDGLRFKQQYAATPADFSKHIDLFNGLLGFNVTSDTMTNYVASGGHSFWSGATRMVTLGQGTSAVSILSGGFNIAPVTASTSTDLSKHLNLYNGQYGFNVTGDTYLNYISSGGHRFANGATTLVTMNTGGTTLYGKLSFGSVTVATPSDFSKHIDIYGGQAGITVTGDTNINYVGFGTHAFYAGATLCAAISSGALTAATALQVTVGGPTWTTGAAVPSSTQPVGSLYSRVGGAVGATLYVSRGAGTWAPVAGV